MPSSKNPVACWDISWKYEGTEFDTVRDYMKEHSKKWAFQHEKGDLTGYEHYQCRLSLNVKTRLPPNLPSDAHATPTSKENMNNFNYVTKDFTRINGPWTYQDELEVFVPWHLVGKKDTLYAWQQQIWDSADLREERIINVILDTAGCQGKSTIANLMDVYHRGISMTAYNDYKLVTQSLCNQLVDTDNRDPRCILFDLERARKQDELAGLYSAIESIKNGIVSDWRNRFVKWRFHPPVVWVFMNTVPDRAYATADRWKIWEISTDRTLAALSL